MKKYCRKCKSEVQKNLIPDTKNKNWKFFYYKCKCTFDLKDSDMFTLKELRKEKLKSL